MNNTLANSQAIEKRKLITKRLKKEIKWFVRHTPTGRLSRNLRTLLLQFLEQDGMEGAPYRQPLFSDLQNLFRLLDTMEREVKGVID